jgi:hypothetical protein
MTPTLRVPSFSYISKWLLLVISPGGLLLGQTTSALGITIKAPLAGSPVSGVVIPSLKISNAVGAVSVQLLVDGFPVSAITTLPPYVLTWNTLSVPNGAHSLSAVARDAAQNQATTTISLSVSNAPSQVIAITVGPTNANLTASQTQQFTATVAGSSNTSASWSLSPQVGSISSSGLYTAPATITGAQNVTVMATSLADATKTATAVVVLTPSVSITLGPANSSLLASQAQQFTATVSGSSNTGASWSINPQVGSISNGLYTAPATITSAQNVTVTATSLADTTKTATAAVALTPGVSISLGPATTSLIAYQTQQFTATVSGSSNTGVSWSISPLVGSISSSGLYTAPTKVKLAQTVTVTASSLADPTKTATAPIALLTPVVSITVGPANASLTASQTQQFTTTVTGISQTGVSWTISPPLGTVSSSGLYTAPATISTAQSIMLTATSLADATKTAAAVIALTLSPISAQFSISMSAPVDGSRVSGNVGISATAGGSVAGVQFYADSVPVGAQLTAPPYTVNWNSVSVPDGTHRLSAMAQDTAGNRSTSTISVAVSNAPTVSAVTLPVEVMGAAGFTQSVQVNVASVPSGALRLWLQIHGLSYQTQASVQVNSSGWMPINDSTATLLGQAGVYGGIGGGFHTIKMTLNLPQGTVLSGTNTVNFRFNGTDGRVSGFRVLDFNFVGPDGTGVLPEQTFVYDDPNTWQAPSTLASDIAAGKALWYGAALTVPATNSPAPIRANCSSCHAQDGRDLKYFNYSNNSIRTRSIFHGLTAQQGDQIACYIRSLNAPNPGRPWNPPYQPGPGTDSKPVSDWAAGAGLDAVLDHDSDMLPYLMPNGIPANWAWNAYLNARETPIALQLPDWNHWLPTVHPLDGWGDQFTNSSLQTEYVNIRSQLRPDDAASYATVKDSIAYWLTRDISFQGLIIQPQSSPLWNDPAFVGKFYSYRLWSIVKLWELNQEFQLEGMSRAIFGPQAADRAWYTNMAFSASPFMTRIPRPSPGIGNGTKVAHIYLSFAWYQMQLILNDGNGKAAGTNPIDWGYSLGYPENDLTWDSDNARPRVGSAGLLVEWMVKTLQAIAGNDTNPLRLVVFPAQVSTWSEIPASTKLQIMNAWVGTWFSKYGGYTALQMYATGLASPAIDLTQESFGGDVMYALPQLRYQGVNPALLNQVAAWASTIWPGYNWVNILNTPCSVYNLGQIVCK